MYVDDYNLGYTSKQRYGQNAAGPRMEDERGV